MDDANYVFSEVPIKANVSSSQTATPEELVELAKKLWAQVQESGVSKDDDEGNKTLLKRMQDENKDFMMSFPIILRWMVQARQFGAKSFHKWLLKHSASELKDREDFLRLQAEYLVLLYKESNPRYDNRLVNEYRKSITQQLLDEDKKFKELHDQVTKDMEAHEAILRQERRERLIALVRALKDKPAAE